MRELNGVIAHVRDGRRVIGSSAIELSLLCSHFLSNALGIFAQSPQGIDDAHKGHPVGEFYLTVAGMPISNAGINELEELGIADKFRKVNVASQFRIEVIHCRQQLVVVAKRKVGRKAAGSGVHKERNLLVEETQLIFVVRWHQTSNAIRAQTASSIRANKRVGIGVREQNHVLREVGRAALCNQLLSSKGIANFFYRSGLLFLSHVGNVGHSARRAHVETWLNAIGKGNLLGEERRHRPVIYEIVIDVGHHQVSAGTRCLQRRQRSLKAAWVSLYRKIRIDPGILVGVQEVDEVEVNNLPLKDRNGRGLGKIQCEQTGTYTRADFRRDSNLVGRIVLLNKAACIDQIAERVLAGIKQVNVHLVPFRQEIQRREAALLTQVEVPKDVAAGKKPLGICNVTPTPAPRPYRYGNSSLAHEHLRGQKVFYFGEVSLDSGLQGVLQLLLCSHQVGCKHIHPLVLHAGDFVLKQHRRVICEVHEVAGAVGFLGRETLVGAKDIPQKTQSVQGRLNCLYIARVNRKEHLVL